MMIGKLCLVLIGHDTRCCSESCTKCSCVFDKSQSQLLQVFVQACCGKLNSAGTAVHGCLSSGGYVFNEW